jgi:hypothetical protein
LLSTTRSTTAQASLTSTRTSPLHRHSTYHLLPSEPRVARRKRHLTSIQC